jgi:hypothetical protein
MLLYNVTNAGGVGEKVVDNNLENKYLQQGVNSTLRGGRLEKLHSRDPSSLDPKIHPRRP